MTDAPNPIGAAIAANQSHTFQDDDRGDCCECGEGIAHPNHQPADQDEAAVDRRRYAAIASDVLRHANRIETTMFTGSIGLENHHTLTDKETLAFRVCVEVATKHDAEIAALHAKLAEANQYRNGHLPTCAGMDMARMICDCGYLDGTAYRELLSERDMYKLGMEDAQHNKQSALTAMNVEAERADKALAELAAEREAHKLERGAREHTWTRLGKVVEDRDAARAEADSLRFQMKSWIAANGPGGWIDNLRNKCASLHDLIASKDNEIAALKARTVKLQVADVSMSELAGCATKMQMRLDADAIRAAGVKVKGFCHV